MPGKTSQRQLFFVVLYLGSFYFCSYFCIQLNKAETLNIAPLKLQLF